MTKFGQLSFIINQFSLIGHFASIRQAAAVGLKWQMINVKSMVNGQCEMVNPVRRLNVFV